MGVICWNLIQFQGLMIGVEMVSDPETRKPLDSTTFVDIWEDCKDMGVLFGKGGLNGNVSMIRKSREPHHSNLI